MSALISARCASVVRPIALDARPLRWNLVGVAAVALLICTGGPSTYTALHLVDDPGNLWVRAVPFGAVAVAGALLLANHLVRLSPRRYPIVLYAVAGYVVWASLSTIWSVAPNTTARESLIGAGIAAFGVWFGWCLTIREQIWAVALAMSAAVLASAWAIRYRPSFGQVYMGIAERTQWQGIFGNRNSLAPVCVLGLLGLVGLVLTRPPVAVVVATVPVAAAHVILLWGSGGLTSTLALVMMVGITPVVPFLWWLRRQRIPGWSIVAATIAIGIVGWVFVFSHFDSIATRLGRDATLTGRRLIWADARSFISQRPIAGAGFSAFWDRADLTAASYERVGGAYASAHNSVLEVLLGLGVVGLIFFLVVALSAIVGTFRWSWRGPSLAAQWWVLLVVFEVAQHAMESFVLWHSYLWVLLIAAAFVTYGPSFPRHESASEDEELPAGSVLA
jgi:exopolysaccharide production protein ExoQ